MNTTYMAFIVAILAVVVGALWYTRTPNVETESGDTQSETLGEYAYTCDDDVAFMMIPASDMSAITILPVVDAVYPVRSTLAESPTDTGRRFRSAEYEFHGRGEGVTLYDVSSAKTYTCIPQPKPDEAPFNFGD